MIMFLPEMLAESLANETVFGSMFLFLLEGEEGDISFPEASGRRA